jgi:hypothetical protein
MGYRSVQDQAVFLNLYSEPTLLLAEVHPQLLQRNRVVSITNIKSVRTPEVGAV